MSKTDKTEPKDNEETVVQLCELLQTTTNWWSPSVFASHVLSAYEHEMALRDAKTAELQSLVRELSDTLERVTQAVAGCSSCEAECNRGSDGCLLTEATDLVKRARLAVKTEAS